MFNTLRATLSPSGSLTFEETVKITRPVTVLVTLLDEQPTSLSRESEDQEATIVPIPDSAPPRTALWSRLTAIREQADKEGVLPEPLSWDGILEEVERRRGERSD